jgi:iron(III) transport system substrate-binding protein
VALQAAMDEAGLDIQMTFYRAAGIEMNATFVNEQVAGLNRADYIMADADDLINHINAGYLLAQPLANRADFVESSLHPEDYWVPIEYSPFFIAYNTNLVKPEDVPDSWRDLADPKFKNLLAMADPRTSVAIQYPLTYWTQTLAADFGWDFVKELGAQEPMLTTGHSQLVDMLVRGEAAVIPVMLAPVLAPLQNGEPIAVALAKEGGPISLVAGAVVKSAPHQADAIKFHNWLASAEGQQAVASYGIAVAYKPIDQRLPDGTDLRQFDATRLSVPPDVRADNIERVIEAFGL